jgi:hypothetical protein
MRIGRGDDYPFGCFGLVLDGDNSSQRMFGFDTSLLIPGEPEYLISMLSDKLSGEQEHPARRAVSYAFTSRADHLVTLRRARAPHPPPLVINSLALTTHRWIPEFALCFVLVVLQGPNRSVFLISGKM